MTTRKELIEALRLRYRSAAFGDRIKILDEFVALTGAALETRLVSMKLTPVAGDQAAYPVTWTARGPGH